MSAMRQTWIFHTSQATEISCSRRRKKADVDSWPVLPPPYVGGYKASWLTWTFACWLSLLLASPGALFAQNSFNRKFQKIVFGCYTSDLKEFETFVKRAKASGATHINLSNEDLPWARWEYDTEGDPYPSWVCSNLGLLKIATPKALKPYLPQDYAEGVLKILEERCKVLRKYGLKGALRTFEPQMLPEKVFTDHPLWRGPRVDQPSRSRVARWAPDIDNPEVLQLYGEALAILLKRCPEIELLSLTTNDSGTGLSWSGGLYSGATGNTFNKHRRMDQRILSFFSVLREAAKKAGGNLEIDISSTREEFPERIAAGLERGMAIENLEGPDARQFKYEVGFLLDYYQPFYPVQGIPDPVKFLEDLQSANESRATRVFVLLGDRFNRDLYFEIYDRFNASAVNDALSRLQLLNNLAKSKVGEPAASDLLDLWLALREARKPLHLAENGGHIFHLGSVQQRWLTRPFVPFPDNLESADRDYFRKFQFQARTEEHANDLADLQASRVYAGWSGRFFVSKLMSSVRTSVSQARNAISILQKADPKPEQEMELRLLDLRLQALALICNNAENAISYQAQLDRVKALESDPEFRPEAGTPSGWDRNLILETARREVDNTAKLLQLLESSDEVILDLAPAKDLEDIRRLGPKFKAQLKQKLRIMNEHWLDYNRIFTTPNR
jgi:hypothetical protein